MSDITRILRIDSSARTDGSVTRALTDKVIDQLSSTGPVTVKVRDLSAGIPFVDAAWVGANFTASGARTSDQIARLVDSDELVRELESSDVLVMGVPIYNFGVPATVKAWIDQIARVGLTFKYTENGPEGLLTGKKAIIAVASGGTPVGSEIDFATPYIRHVLGFVGIHDVTFIAADALGADADAKIEAAGELISKMAA